MISPRLILLPAQFRTFTMSSQLIHVEGLFLDLIIGTYVTSWLSSIHRTLYETAGEERRGQEHIVSPARHDQRDADDELIHLLGIEKDGDRLSAADQPNVLAFFRAQPFGEVRAHLRYQ
jgi:hypothetical protein